MLILHSHAPCDVAFPYTVYIYMYNYNLWITFLKYLNEYWLHLSCKISWELIFNSVIFI